MTRKKCMFSDLGKRASVARLREYGVRFYQIFGLASCKYAIGIFEQRRPVSIAFKVILKEQRLFMVKPCFYEKEFGTAVQNCAALDENV